MLLVFNAMGILQQTDVRQLLVTCDQLSRQIYCLAKSKMSAEQ